MTTGYYSEKKGLTFEQQQNLKLLEPSKNEPVTWPQIHKKKKRLIQRDSPLVFLTEVH